VVVAELEVSVPVGDLAWRAASLCAGRFARSYRW
jgi:hypothetical protein